MRAIRAPSFPILEGCLQGSGSLPTIDSVAIQTALSQTKEHRVGASGDILVDPKTALEGRIPGIATSLWIGHSSGKEIVHGQEHEST